MADLDAPLVTQVPHIPQRQGISDVHHHRHADDLGAGFDVEKGARLCHAGRLGGQVSSLKTSALTLPRMLIGQPVSRDQRKLAGRQWDSLTLHCGIQQRHKCQNQRGSMLP